MFFGRDRVTHRKTVKKINISRRVYLGRSDTYWSYFWYNYCDFMAQLLISIDGSDPVTGIFIPMQPRFEPTANL